MSFMCGSRKPARRCYNQAMTSVAPLPIPSPLYDLPGSAFIVVTGQPGNGKSLQAMRLLTARAPCGRPAAAPTLLLIVEASGEGTIGELIADESLCLTWPVASCDEAIAALATCFPAGRGPLTLGEARKAKHAEQVKRALEARHPPPAPPAPTARDAWPLRSVGVDSVSTLLQAQKAAVRAAAAKARKGPTSTAAAAAAPSVSGKDLENDPKRIAALAAGPAQTLVDKLSGLTSHHRGILVVVACHTCKLEHTTVIGEGPSAEKFKEVYGEAPDFGAATPVRGGIVATGYSALWQSLATKATTIAHCYGTPPVFAVGEVDKINDPGPAGDVRFGLVLQRGVYPSLGPVLWPKRQGGNGWLSMIDAGPRVWDPAIPWSGRDAFVEHVNARIPDSTWDGGPDLGLLLELCLAEHAARDAGEVA